MTLEWINIGTGHMETPEGWWVIWDEAHQAWEFGYRGMVMGCCPHDHMAKAECERMEANSE